MHFLQSIIPHEAHLPPCPPIAIIFPCADVQLGAYPEMWKF